MMKRPFALLGCTALITLAAAVCLGAEKDLVLAAVCAAAGFCALTAAVCLKRNKKLSGLGALRAFSVVLLTSSLFLLLFVRGWEREAAPAAALSGEKASIRGTVIDRPEEQYHKYYYLIRAERVTIEGEEQDMPAFTARISTWTPLSCEPYDLIECTVTFTPFDSSGGLYSTRNSQLAHGAVIGGYVSDYNHRRAVRDDAVSLREFFTRSRLLLGRVFEKRLPRREAGLLRAVLLGDRDLVSDRDYLNFRQIGASHLLTISGLHMAALAAFLRAVLRKIFPGRRTPALLCAGGILLFLMLIGFPVSATRGGVMYVLYLIADAIDRRPDPVNSLGAAVFLICLFSPFSGCDLGFHLSVLGTLGLFLLSGPLVRLLQKPLHGRLRRILSPVTSSLAFTLSVMLFTLPIQMFVFGGMSLLAPLAGLLLTLPCILMVYLGFPAALLGLFPLTAPLSDLFLLCAGWSARLSCFLSERLAGVHGAFLDLTRPVWGILLAAAALLGGVACLSRLEKTVTCTALAAVILLWTCGGVLEHTTRRDAVTIATVPGSTCVAVIRGDRAAVLSLGGYRTGAASALLHRANVRKVQALLMPVRDSDAREAARELLTSFPVESLILPEGCYVGKDLLTAGKTAALTELQEGGTVTLLDGITVTAEQDMARLTFRIYGTDYIIENGSTGPGRCGVLFSPQIKTEIHSAFTVLQNDDIIEPKKGAGGTYIQPGGQGLFLDLYPDGAIRLRGESACLQSTKPS